MTLISKHLSWGFFKNSLTFAPFADTPAIYTIYESLLSHAAYTYRSPELMFYMILELVSGTSYNAILYQQPVPLEELKPELYAAICGIFKQFRIRKKRKKRGKCRRGSRLTVLVEKKESCYGRILRLRRVALAT